MAVILTYVMSPFLWHSYSSRIAYTLKMEEASSSEMSVDTVSYSRTSRMFVAAVKISNVATTA